MATQHHDGAPSRASEAPQHRLVVTSRDCYICRGSKSPEDPPCPQEAGLTGEGVIACALPSGPLGIAQEEDNTTLRPYGVSMAPPTAGISKRRSRIFVRTGVSATHATAAIAAMMPNTTPPFTIGTTHRPPAFPLPLPQLPGTEAAAKRTTTPPERPPPQLRTRTSPPVALSMPSLDMETTPPSTFSFAPTNPYSPPSMSRLDTEITPPRSYAAVLNTNPDSPPHAPPRPSLRTAPTPSPPKKTAQQPPLAPASRKIPPIVVDRLPDWPHHFRKLRELLGHIPNARPATGLSWFAYAPPAERSLKLAIRGLPLDTDVAVLEEELRNRGFEPTFIRPIQAREGRPGCIFFTEIRRTLGFQRVYEISELLCMPGIKVEAWRGRRGAAQCHRCQQFRHSSHNCHRPAACVRCGECHTASECPRPRDDPATCCNCGGPHPANSPSCPVKMRELRNTRAGTAPTTVRRPTPPAVSIVDPGSEPTAQGSLMAAANGPDGPKPKRPRIRRRANPAPVATTTAEPIAVEPVPPQPSTSETAAAAPPKGKKARLRAEAPPAPSSEKLEVLEETMQLLHNILAAIRTQTDPVPIIFQRPNFNKVAQSCPPNGANGRLCAHHTSVRTEK
ncbi:uncharacterized protein LOC126381122 [Pectinophora gossypiella]|uniref:uncharacterized protein LOC126381122 n=1 Tax=Pectinophora gossypiella TaxID=13191 RepID=UPI00214F2D7B|nr:uncharacterized protein LOC126381122 [Pectinophora gossypiella]